MKKVHILLISFLLGFISITVYSQDTPPVQKENVPRVKQQESFWDRVSIGGGLQAQFGTYTLIDVSPEMIYRVTNSLYAGIGLRYLYSSYRYYSERYSSSGYGGSILARYLVWQGLFVQAEYDPIYFTFYTEQQQVIYKEEGWAHDLLIGAGYQQWLGGKAFAQFMIFYNVNESFYSPYRNPIIRIGFGVGL